MKENRVKRAYRRLAEYAERQAERLALREHRKREAWRRIGRRLSGARTRASNAWYRAAGRQISGTRQGIRNARNQRTLERGRRDMPRRASDSLRSSLPVVRNRIDRSTGRPNRDARELGRTSDQSLARMAPRIRADRAARQAPDASPLGPATRSPEPGGRGDVASRAARVISRERADRFIQRRGRSPR